MLVIICGKTGSGKTTLAKLLDNEFDFKKIKTTTTRNKRNGENEDDYHFVSNKDFESMKKLGCFVETSEFNGVSYGTEFHELLKPTYHNKTGVIILDPKGMERLSKLYKSDCITVYLEVPKEELKFRLHERKTENEVEIEERLKIDDKRFKGIKTDICITGNNKSFGEAITIIREEIEKRKHVKTKT